MDGGHSPSQVGAGTLCMTLDCLGLSLGASLLTVVLEEPPFQDGLPLEGPPP